MEKWVFKISTQEAFNITISIWTLLFLKGILLILSDASLCRIVFKPYSTLGKIIFSSIVCGFKDFATISEILYEACKSSSSLLKFTFGCLNVFTICTSLIKLTTSQIIFQLSCFHSDIACSFVAEKAHRQSSVQQKIEWSQSSNNQHCTTFISLRIRPCLVSVIC